MPKYLADLTKGNLIENLWWPSFAEPKKTRQSIDLEIDISKLELEDIPCRNEFLGKIRWSYLFLIYPFPFTTYLDFMSLEGKRNDDRHACLAKLDSQQTWILCFKKFALVLAKKRSEKHQFFVRPYCSCFCGLGCWIFTAFSKICFQTPLFLCVHIDLFLSVHIDRESFKKTYIFVLVWTDQCEHLHKNGCFSRHFYPKTEQYEQAKAGLTTTTITTTYFLLDLRTFA